MTPERRRGVEYLDDPATPDAVRRDAMADLARSNAIFGGRAAVLSALRSLVAVMPRQATLLDVGAGGGEIAERARIFLAWAGIDAKVIGADVVESLVHDARARMFAGVVGEARSLPLRDAAVDVVLCSQLLHHFEHREAVALVAELDRVSRGWVIIADLRRSWFAAAGFWLASLLLRFHPVTRHDGVVSVMRGFTVAELEALVREATGTTPVMRRTPFWRLTATWRAGTVADA